MAAVLIVAVLLVAVGAATRSGQLPVPSDSEVIAGSTPVDTKLYRDPQLLAIEAAREDSRLSPIAETPQAKWFSDWSTTATVRRDIGDYLWGATLANAIPTIVLYRIPQLDCGGNALAGQVYTGARDEQEYQEWVDAAAEALTGHSDAIVILEPDALAQLGQCEQGDRVSSLQYAVDALSDTGARVYIDAGHGNWLSATEVADRLKTVGVDKIAGFSLNVSNYNSTEDEVRYAESVRFELSKLGVDHVHYVIDIGRNGAGSQDTFCNAPGARLGHAPQLFWGGALDGLLWVKNPGETDGTCQGGPAIGFWASAAHRLLGEGDQATGVWRAAEWIALVLVGGVAVAAVSRFAVVGRRKGAHAANTPEKRRR
ncbi:glycoside hydrolase family 6 protein [Mycolicibacterium sp. F2034L]|uniref:glycoside hydrolase family 6 protein n=1 Tax=Mycolicibacterium sp. F2034L TaxID=2926422 RepID=UPI001FF60E87|nr:glycoside hydrolase family 6 protein [Mycolicibacterium sp. F2034L]MCK0175613.1 glycoside hydrolase family 6 protein [Mycolicibacterium sp. F2034L]